MPRGSQQGNPDARRALIPRRSKRGKNNNQEPSPVVVRLPLHSPQRQSPRRQVGARARALAPVPPDPVDPPQPTVQAAPPGGGPFAAAPSTDAPSGSGGPVESMSRSQRGKGLYKKNIVTGNSGPLLAIISARCDDYRNACGGQRVTATKERR